MVYIAAVIMSICGFILGYLSCQIRLSEKLSMLATDAAKDLVLLQDFEYQGMNVDERKEYFGGVLEGIEKCQKVLMKS